MSKLSARHVDAKLKVVANCGNKQTAQMRANPRCLFRVCYSKGVGHPHSCLAETQRQAGDWGSFTVENRASGVPWWEVAELGKLEAGQLEVGHCLSLVWAVYSFPGVTGWL